MSRANSDNAGIEVLLKALKLSSFAACHAEVAKAAEQEGASYTEYLRQLAERELEERRRRRITRLHKQAQLDTSKTMASLETKRFSRKVQQMTSKLASGEFLDRAENVLVFGLPGRGKSHLVNALGFELVEKGRSVLHCPTYQIVQRLLRAKRELDLSRELSKLNRFEVLILDDLGYVQQTREEMEVLFTLLAHRYERGSVMITSNLKFSEWDQLFKDPMTTMAAIDRLVHHSHIIELTGTSYRHEAAEKRLRGKKGQPEE